MTNVTESLTAAEIRIKELEKELARSRHLHDATCFVNINLLKARIKELESNVNPNS